MTTVDVLERDVGKDPWFASTSLNRLFVVVIEAVELSNGEIPTSLVVSELDLLLQSEHPDDIEL
jgi:hypothetical protein